MDRHWPDAQAARGGAIEEELDRRIDDGGQRKVGHRPVEHEVDVDDGRLAEPDLGWEHAVGHESLRHLGRRGDHHGVGDLAPLVASPPRSRRRARAATACTRAPSTTSTPALSSARAGRSPCNSPSGTVDQPTSPASARSNRPVRNTLTARASDASGGGDIDRRQCDEVPEPLDGHVALAVTGQPTPEGDRVERGISRIEAAQGQRRPGQPDAVSHPQVPCSGPSAGAR